MNNKTKFYGNRLYLARNFWGLSCQELATKINVSKQYINQLEKDLKKPNPMMVNALACALEVYPEFFAINEGVLPENLFNFRG